MYDNELWFISRHLLFKIHRTLHSGFYIYIYYEGDTSFYVRVNVSTLQNTFEENTFLLRNAINCHNWGNFFSRLNVEWTRRSLPFATIPRKLHVRFYLHYFIKLRILGLNESWTLSADIQRTINWRKENRAVLKINCEGVASIFVFVVNSIN